MAAQRFPPPPIRQAPQQYPPTRLAPPPPARQAPQNYPPQNYPPSPGYQQGYQQRGYQQPGYQQRGYQQRGYQPREDYSNLPEMYVPENELALVEYGKGLAIFGTLTMDYVDELLEMGGRPNKSLGSKIGFKPRFGYIFFNQPYEVLQQFVEEVNSGQRPPTGQSRRRNSPSPGRLPPPPAQLPPPPIRSAPAMYVSAEASQQVPSDSGLATQTVTWIVEVPTVGMTACAHIGSDKLDYKVVGLQSSANNDTIDTIILEQLDNPDAGQSTLQITNGQWQARGLADEHLITFGPCPANA